VLHDRLPQPPQGPTPLPGPASPLTAVIRTWLVDRGLLDRITHGHPAEGRRRASQRPVLGAAARNQAISGSRTRSSRQPRRASGRQTAPTGLAAHSLRLAHGSVPRVG
jgi:hypothetical protein